MCRMFAYIGDSRDEIDLLVEALSRSAERDTVAEASGLKKTVHPDGWGYVMYSKKLNVNYRRSDKPIFEEDVMLPRTEGETFVLFHARQASPGTRVGEAFSHPFRIEKNGGSIFLAHNGALSRKRLAYKLQENENSTDSELALKYIVLKDDLESATLDLEEYTKENSALDLLLLLTGRNFEATKILVKQYYRRQEGKSDKTKYYLMCHQTLARGKAVFSSTLNEYGFSGKPILGNGLVSLSSLI